MFLAYAAPAGYALIDRELYLPESWTGDRPRCADAGIGDDVEFATKPELARAMIERALDAGVPAAWVAGDEVYGADPALRDLAARGLGYVLAVPVTTRSPPAAGHAAAIDLAAAAARRGPGSGCPPGRRQGPALVRLGPDRDQRSSRHQRLRRLAADPPQRSATGSWRTTGATHHAPVPGTELVRSPAPAGRSRSPSPAARNSPPSTSTRSAAGPPGTAGPSWPCSPTRSLRADRDPPRSGHRRPRSQPRTGLIPLTLNEIRHLFTD